jgi:phosphoglycerol transferase MdoB-like AlkP superfamily enzyme
MFSDFLKPAAVLFRVYLSFIAVFAIGRAVFIVYFYDRIIDADHSLWWTFLYGLRLDTITACAFLLIPALLISFLPGAWAKAGSTLTSIFLLLLFVLAVYMENATLPFIAEYDVRPNVIFINYLKYPKEVANTIWSVYKLELLLAGLMMAAFGWWFYRRIKPAILDVYSVTWWKRAIVFVPIFIIIFAGLRSSFGHRPANPSDAVFSNNRLLNELAKNTIHNVVYAAYSRVAHDGTADKYGSMKIDEALRRVGSRLNIETTGETPFMREVVSHFSSDKKKNLVIFLQESIGAQFVEAIGGEPGIMPHLNALSEEGLLFARLYSNGTRSIRGISGTVAGFLSTPGQGVVKRNQSQSGFFTVAGLLKPHGYRSSFFYGGESRFDNMKSWFFGNGFDEIYDEPTFTEASFHGTWGVSDEDMVVKANQLFSEWNKAGEPFVSVMFSTTNHSPFEFPEGRIELLPGVPVQSDKNAIKFADYAIGKFIALAKVNGYYDDTVIMIIADHNVRVYGDDIIPVDTFRVPALILGGGVTPERVERLVTQPDALATALDLLGLDLAYPILGNSIFSDRQTGVSLLQFHELYGLRYEDEIAVIQPDKPAQTFHVTADDHLEPAEHNAALEKDALAFVIVLDHLYRNRLYTTAPVIK